MCFHASQAGLNLKALRHLSIASLQARVYFDDNKPYTVTSRLRRLLDQIKPPDQIEDLIQKTIGDFLEVQHNIGEVKVRFNKNKIPRFVDHNVTISVDWRNTEDHSQVHELKGIPRKGTLAFKPTRNDILAGHKMKSYQAFPLRKLIRHGTISKKGWRTEQRRFLILPHHLPHQIQIST
ncbi:hypothetical protein J3R30DRAFT_1577459 [Lentinula aciculospora]|uniref:Uncharacterized protein n=1 Tax=Lentinula aciculospora TaxID=153920 RepID=A0A9W9DGD6_9AGAR|nr:hypothetical protein J3R30DRAFT_1577459 [Lentinula aciculospora]